jgi:transposase
MDHPPYSPDLSPCNYFFPKLKITLNGKRFADIPDIKCNDNITARYYGE